MFRVGIAGCGYWGSKHLRVFNEIPGSKVISVCDPDAARLELVNRTYPLTYTTTDVDEFLASDIEGVVVATPVSTHYPLARRALLAGKSVLVEKPLTTSSAEAQDLIQLAESAGLTLSVGHTFLYNPAVRMLKSMVAGGDLGTILHVHSARLSFGLLQPDVNVLWDLAPHDLSILLYILGQAPVAAAARGSGCYDAALCEVAHADLTFADNVTAHIHVSWLDPSKVRRMTIAGSRQMVVYDDMAGSEPLRIYGREIKFPSRNGSKNGSRNGSGSRNGNGQRHPPMYGYGDVRIPHIPDAEPLREECADFMESVRSGKSPASDGAMGLAVVRVLECLQRSLSNGGAMERLAEVESRVPSSRPAANGGGAVKASGR